MSLKAFSSLCISENHTQCIIFIQFHSFIYNILINQPTESPTCKKQKTNKKINNNLVTSKPVNWQKYCKSATTIIFRELENSHCRYCVIYVYITTLE